MSRVLTMAGMIGVGKSSLTELVADHFDSEAYFESVGDNNPILDKFYDDPEKWAFHLQVHFLNERFKSIKQALVKRENVLDRSIYEDALFTQINHELGRIDSVSYDLYLDLLDNMMEEIEGMPKKSPDLMIYLHGSFDEVMRRIKKRGREFENPDEDEELYEYFKLLHSRYDDWARNFDKCPVVWINIDEFDFVDNKEDAKKVLEKIEYNLL